MRLMGATVAMAFVLTACGGGGGSSNSADGKSYLGPAAIIEDLGKHGIVCDNYKPRVIVDANFAGDCSFGGQDLVLATFDNGTKARTAANVLAKNLSDFNLGGTIVLGSNWFINAGKDFVASQIVAAIGGEKLDLGTG